MEELENVISDIVEWKKEQAKLIKEQQEIEDKLEALEDDIDGAYAALNVLIQEKTSIG